MSESKQKSNNFGKWDNFFKKHLKRAEEKGIDVNESVEDDWGGTMRWLENYILPAIRKPNPVICEIGPGSGRFSRHLIERAKMYYFVDYSDFVCDLLEKMFGSRENARIIKAQNSDLSSIESNSVDFVFSMGTFVHLFIEQIYGYFSESYRILSQNSQCVIHFANFMDDGGYDFFIEKLPINKQYDRHSAFRFYHPEMIDKMAVKIGFSVVNKNFIRGTRHCFIRLKKN
jgi:ubiquinone/menaquinone biosynthesis C-methylase UbiE